MKKQKCPDCNDSGILKVGTDGLFCPCPIGIDLELEIQKTNLLFDTVE